MGNMNGKPVVFTDEGMFVVNSEFEFYLFAALLYRVKCRDGAGVA
jgi:hypothetical protein